MNSLIALGFKAYQCRIALVQQLSREMQNHVSSEGHDTSTNGSSTEIKRQKEQHRDALILSSLVDSFALWNHLVSIQRRCIRKNMRKLILVMKRLITSILQVEDPAQESMKLEQLLHIQNEFINDGQKEDKTGDEALVDIATDIPFVLGQILWYASQKDIQIAKDENVKLKFYADLAILVQTLKKRLQTKFDTLIVPTILSCSGNKTLEYLLSFEVTTTTVTEESKAAAIEDKSKTSTIQQDCRRTVAVVGYGRIGKAIVNELILQGRYKVIVVTHRIRRSFSPSTMTPVEADPEEEKTEQGKLGVPAFRIPGAEVRFVDCSDDSIPDFMSCTNAFQQVFCVISTLPQHLAGTDTEEIIARAARQAQVEQFIPSYFVPRHDLKGVGSLNLNLQKGAFVDEFLPSLSEKNKQQEQLSSVAGSQRTATLIADNLRKPLYYTAVSVGIITDFWFPNLEVGFKVESKGKHVEIPVFGEGPQMVSYITLCDLAKLCCSIIGKCDLYNSIVEAESFSASSEQIASLAAVLFKRKVLKSLKTTMFISNEYARLTEDFGMNDPSSFLMGLKLVACHGFQLVESNRLDMDAESTVSLLDVLLGCFALTSLNVETSAGGNASLYDLRPSTKLLASPTVSGSSNQSRSLLQQIAEQDPSFYAAMNAAKCEPLALQCDPFALVMCLHEAISENLGDCCATAVELANFSKDRCKQLEQALDILQSILKPLRECELRMFGKGKEESSSVQELIQLSFEKDADCESVALGSVSSALKFANASDVDAMMEYTRVIQVAVISWAEEAEFLAFLIRAVLIYMERHVAVSNTGGLSDVCLNSGRGIFWYGTLGKAILMNRNFISEPRMRQAIKIAIQSLRDYGSSSALVDAFADSIRASCEHGEETETFSNVLGSDGDSSVPPLLPYRTVTAWTPSPNDTLIPRKLVPVKQEVSSTNASNKQERQKVRKTEEVSAVQQKPQQKPQNVRIAPKPKKLCGAGNCDIQ